MAVTVILAIFAIVFVSWRVKAFYRSSRTLIHSLQYARESLARRRAARAMGQPIAKPRTDHIIASTALITGMSLYLYSRLAHHRDLTWFSMLLMLAGSGYIYFYGKAKRKLTLEGNGESHTPTLLERDPSESAKGVLADGMGESVPGLGKPATRASRWTEISRGPLQAGAAAAARLRKQSAAYSRQVNRQAVVIGGGLAVVLIAITVFAITTAADHNRKPDHDSGRSMGAPTTEQPASLPPREAERRGVISCGTVQVIGGRSAEVMFVRTTEGPSEQWNCDHAKQIAFTAYARAISQGASTVTLDGVQCSTKPDPTGPFASSEYMLTCSDQMGSGLGLRPQ